MTPGRSMPMIAALALLLCGGAQAAERDYSSLFEAGVTAYRAGEYSLAADMFQHANLRQLSSGGLRNLGNAEWKTGRTGRAILAWEQAVWVDPFDGVARTNLLFARRVAQVETPELRWYEAASTWLPSWWWAAIAGISLWTAIGAAVLPGVLRVRKAAWHQTVAALGLAVFFLSLPAHVGVASRSKLAVVLERDTALRLTPTTEGQVVTRLGAGETVRIAKRERDFFFVKSARTRGWVSRSSVGMVCPRG